MKRCGWVFLGGKCWYPVYRKEDGVLVFKRKDEWVPVLKYHPFYLHKKDKK